MRYLISQNSNGSNMVEIDNSVPRNFSTTFIEATKWIENDWITIRLDKTNRDKVRIHVIRVDGTDDNLYFDKLGMYHMSLSRILNLLRQMTHNQVRRSI